ncbi:MAG: DNA primase [Epsilonproteobacteria bacterium]|nr:DNA primase [Campylobacterota bacterium]
MIKQESIQQLKSIIDIVDVVGNYIPLKKQGSNYTALCPFHSEKTPSFVVSPSKQIYHCFGCGASGDGIKFVMEIEKISYPEALEKLANMYNIKLEYTSNNDYQSLDILDKLNGFYIQHLTANKTAYEYLRKRGLHQSTIEKFALGYAPSSQEQIEFFNQVNFPLQKGVELGVFAKGDRGIYARLIDRITFPIFHNNKIIAYGGRTISNHPAKYINYSNTKLFNKSRTFYGLNFARDKILKTKQIIITEGYMDVIMLHQAGFENVVATLGTALTKDHLPTLNKLHADVIIAYDGDDAGINAAIKAASLLAQNSFDGGVVLFQEGYDPADMIQEGRDVEVLFQNKEAFIPFVIKQIIAKYDISNPLQKQKAYEQIKQFILTLPILIQESVARDAAQLLQIDAKLFRVRKNIPIINTAKKDIAEAAIIKTLYQNPHYIKEISEYLDPQAFHTHAYELELLYQEDFQNPKLLDIILDENIKELDYKELINAVIALLIRYYQNKINQLKFQNMNLFEKSHKIKKYRFVIDKLKKGELAYESDSTI